MMSVLAVSNFFIFLKSVDVKCLHLRDNTKLLNRNNFSIRQIIFPNTLETKSLTVSYMKKSTSFQR